MLSGTSRSGPGPTRTRRLHRAEDAAAAHGSSIEKPGALQVGARPLGRGKLGRVCGRRVEKGRVALPQGAPTGRPGHGARRAWAEVLQLWAAAGPGLAGCGAGGARLLRLSPDFEGPGAWERPAALARLWRRIPRGTSEKEIGLSPRASRGARLTWTAGAEMRGRWGAGPGGAAAGAEAPRGPGRALLGPDGPAVSLLRLDSPSGRSPGWRDRPEAVSARTLRPGRPLLLSSLQSLGVGPRGWVRGPCCVHTCAGPERGRTQFWRGVCANVGRARTCRHGVACVAAAYGSACWGARAPSANGQSMGTPGSARGQARRQPQSQVG